MPRYQLKSAAPYLRDLAIAPGASLPDEFPFNLPILQKGRLHLRFTKRITILAGENGSGKSSLLEAIAAQAGFNLSGGSRDNFYGREVEEGQRTFARVLRLGWRPRIGTGYFLRAESFFNFSSHIDEVAEVDPVRAYAVYGGKSLHHRSHGESFLALFEGRFGSVGLYLLDEPEAALSPSRQFAFLRVLRALDRAGRAQIIMATHSPILMAYPDAQLLYFEGGSIREIGYEDTAHFKVMRSFMADPARSLADLFADNEKGGR